MANPIAAILSGALLLRYAFGKEQQAREIEQAVTVVLKSGYRTADLTDGQESPIGMRKMGQLVIAKLGTR